MVQIVGLHGVARSGKDTVANVLVAKEGYKRLAFADALRDVLYALNPLVLPQARLKTIVDSVGWDEAKTMYPEVRELLQRMGTEAGRDILGKNIWVDVVMRQIREQPDQKFVITDVRFRNEVEALFAYGPDAFLVRIVRPGVNPVNSHVSDAGLPEDLFDAMILNDRGIEELQRGAQALVASAAAYASYR